MLSWIPVLRALRLTELPAGLDRGKKRAEELKEILSTTLVRDAATRLRFLNLVAWGTGGLVMFWVNQKCWQESGVPLAWFGVLLARYDLIVGLSGRSAALGGTRYGRRPLLAAVGVLPWETPRAPGEGPVRAGSRPRAARALNGAARARSTPSCLRGEVTSALIRSGHVPVLLTSEMSAWF
jgi:hypothetical protein